MISKKDEPRLPVIKNGFYNMEYPACDVCGNPIAVVHNYCSKCGQRIDWTEEMKERFG